MLMMIDTRLEHMFELMVADGGKTSSLADYLRRAGYSEAYARNPQKLKNTKSWKECMNKYFPPEELLAVHWRLLYATKRHVMKFPTFMSDNEIRGVFDGMDDKVLSIERLPGITKVHLLIPDNTARARALEMIYRVQGYY
jgi:hypothetical protein